MFAQYLVTRATDVHLQIRNCVGVLAFSFFSFMLLIYRVEIQDLSFHFQSQSFKMVILNKIECTKNRRPVVRLEYIREHVAHSSYQPCMMSSWCVHEYLRSAASHFDSIEFTQNNSTYSLLEVDRIAFYMNQSVILKLATTEYIETTWARHRFIRWRFGQLRSNAWIAKQLFYVYLENNLKNIPMLFTQLLL